MMIPSVRADGFDIMVCSFYPNSDCALPNTIVYLLVVRFPIIYVRLFYA